MKTSWLGRRGRCRAWLRSPAVAAVASGHRARSTRESAACRRVSGAAPRRWSGVEVAVAVDHAQAAVLRSAKDAEVLVQRAQVRHSDAAARIFTRRFRVTVSPSCTWCCESSVRDVGRRAPAPEAAAGDQAPSRRSSWKLTAVHPPSGAPPWRCWYSSSNLRRSSAPGSSWTRCSACWRSRQFRLRIVLA